MGVNDRYRNGFLSHVESSMRGEVTYIPNPLDRVGSVFNLMQSRYTLISGATGSGKTSLLDYLYVLAPYTYLKNTKEEIHWESIYFSLERKALFKHAKWVSWLLYRDHKLQVPADSLLGWGPRPLNTQGYDIVRSFDSEISDILNKVHIYDGKVNPETIRRIIKAKALQLGAFFNTDAEGLYENHSPVPSRFFSDENLVEQTVTGPKKYMIIKYKDKEYKLYQEEHLFIPHVLKTFVFIMIDGINLLGEKKDLDEVSKFLAEARDLYGFSPVVVTQQNRAMGDINRIKLHGADLSPQIEDVFSSSQMGFDADLIIGLFDPYRYKAYDKMGCFDGYVLKSADTSVSNFSMLAPSGFSRFRSLHVLKNTFGADGGKFALKYLGESNHFETLPLPDSPEMSQVYAEIRKGM